MRITINAVALASAGGLSVGLNFLKQIKTHDLNLDKVIVFAPAGCNYEQFRGELIEVIIVPNLFRKHFFRLFTDFIWLPFQIKKTNPDVIFSMGNFAIPIKNPKQALLFHWPYAIYFDEKVLWARMSYRDKLNRWIRRNTFKNRLKYANVIFPQTQTAEERLKRYYPLVQQAVTIPNAYTAILPTKARIQNHFTRVTGFHYLFCLSRYYPHKNIEILIEVAKLIKLRQLPYKIIITLSADQHRNVKLINEQIKKENIADILLNIGAVPFDMVPSLYDNVDALILPTLLESFSGTYVDAMHFERTIFTSNRDFAREVCGDAAYYFDPLSATHIVEVIEKAFANPTERMAKIVTGKERVRTFPNWEKVAEMYVNELKKLHYRT